MDKFTILAEYNRLEAERLDCGSFGYGCEQSQLNPGQEVKQ